MIEGLSIFGSAVFTPTIHRDGRGDFLELLRSGELAEHTGARFRLAQANCVTNVRGVLRGIHFADVPPGQAKYVVCVSGAVLDVVVDLRTGSPTFGSWESVRLDGDTYRGVFIQEGLGHAYVALSEHSTMIYLCSEPYAPWREHGVNPFDPELGITWPDDVRPILSDKDRRAPTVRSAQRQGLLPDYRTCLRYYDELAVGR